MWCIISSYAAPCSYPWGRERGEAGESASHGNPTAPLKSQVHKKVTPPSQRWRISEGEEGSVSELELISWGRRWVEVVGEEGRGRRGVRVGERMSGDVWQSLLVWAAVVQRVNHEGQIRPGRYHGVTWLHHLKAHVVERLDDGHWGENKKTVRGDVISSLRLHAHHFCFETHTHTSSMDTRCQE